jgi:anti-sigma-K factor RskA
MSAEDDQEMLAAEYALGTLDATERDEAQALMSSDPAFAARVQSWEKRLGELHQMVEPVEPPAELWPKILSRVTGIPQSEIRLPEIPTLPTTDPEAEQKIVQLSRRVRRWRGATFMAAAMAATLLLFVSLREFSPGTLPAGLRPAAPAAPAGQFVAVLQESPASPGFILTVDMRSKNFTVRKVGADKPADRSYELWLVHDRFPGPRSLGLIGDDAFTTRPALASFDREVINNATYAVSLEPPGGSPTGEPTGPVVFSGKLIEATPDQP